MKKSLLVAIACALGAIALSSCGGTTVSEMKFPDKLDCSDLSNVAVQLTDAKLTDDQKKSTKSVKLALEPMATTVKIELSGRKVPNYLTTSDKMIGFRFTSNPVEKKTACEDLIYLKEADKDLEAYNEEKSAAKTFYTVDYTSKSIAYSSAVVYTGFKLNLLSMATALKAVDGNSDFNYFEFTMTLSKGSNGLVGLSKRTIPFLA
jgi:hypothetical protein